MKVLFATSEAAPFIKTGGLGDVAGSLPTVLREKGVDARVILPLYKTIPQEYKDRMRYIDHIYIDIAWRKQYCGIFELEHNGCIFYFIDNKFYFNGDKPYDHIHLDCEKFIFFSKAVLSVLPTLDFRPDVINCNDWQTGAIPVFLDTFLDNPFYRGIKTVMTVHNLRFQGRWDLRGIKDAMGISDYYFTPDKLEYYKDANLLKGGMVYANKISTVSNTYAWEITTPEYGEGLDRLLAARSNDLVGIVNGISYTDWNPETDPFIYQNYNASNVTEGKLANKRALQRDLGLPQDDSRMMIGIVSRLTDQKGFDLVAYSIEKLCDGGAQVVVLGTGDEKYENLFRHYDWKYPDKFKALIYFSNEMSHKIYAASDAFLMPSRFEPCGLSQLISLRYGTVPIVRETGGLKDTVWAYNEYTGEGTGFSFANYNADEMMNTIWYAMDVFYNRKDAWYNLIQTGMHSDFSWNTSADKYIKMYQDLTGIYDLPEKKTEPVNEPEPEKTSFEDSIKEQADIHDQAIAEEVTAKVKEIPNPFEDKAEEQPKPEEKAEEPVKTEEKPAVKKTAARKTAAKKAAEPKKTEEAAPAKEKAEEKKTTRKRTVKKAEETAPAEEKAEEKKAAKKTSPVKKTVETDKTETAAASKAAVKAEETAEKAEEKKTTRKRTVKKAEADPVDEAPVAKKTTRKTAAKKTNSK